MRNRISLPEARSIAAAAAGFGLRLPSGAAGSLAALRRLGSVQIDTISVVERAHGHVLWSRNPGYGPEHIDELESAPRRIIEYWSHAAAYLPFEDYRFCIPRMERIKAEGHEWYRADAAVARRVLKRVREEGPLRSSDFGGKRKGSSGWWDWKPEKRALEYLFHAGELVSTGRKAFQKVYDIPERALPADADLRRPSPREHAGYYVDLAASSLGIFRESDVAYLRKDGLECIAEELASRVEDGRLARVEIDGIEDRPGSAHFAPPELLGKRGSGAAILVARILSPFDPLIIDRKRASRLFGRTVQLECYLPGAKRSFGYFALPILVVGEDGCPRLAGLLDAKAERAARVLSAIRLSLDEAPRDRAGNPPSPSAYAAAIAAALTEFAAFNGADRVDLGRLEAYDGRIERSLRAALARLSR